MPPAPSDVLRFMLQAHSLEAVSLNGWLLPGGEPPAMRALWYPIEAQGIGRLDIQVLLKDQRLLTESFAGIGPGAAAFPDALNTFSGGVFHVLLSAFWGVSLPERVVTEEWLISGKRRRVYLGDLTRRLFGPDIPVPDELLPALTTAIRAESLPSGPHWFRSFVCHLPGRPLVVEALCDNKDWPNGKSALHSITWPPSDWQYSVRHFVIVADAA